MVGSSWNFIQWFEIWAGALSELVFGGSETRFKFSEFCIKIPWKLFHTKKPGTCIWISFVNKIEAENVQVGFTPVPEPSEQFFFDLEK